MTSKTVEPEPYTSSLALGVAVPIPTLPLDPVMNISLAVVSLPILIERVLELEPNTVMPLISFITAVPPCTNEVAYIPPLTSNFWEGDSVPIPSLPSAVRFIKLSDPQCPKVNMLVLLAFAFHLYPI